MSSIADGRERQLVAALGHDRVGPRSAKSRRSVLHRIAAVKSSS